MRWHARGMLYVIGNQIDELTCCRGGHGDVVRVVMGIDDGKGVGEGSEGVEHGEAGGVGVSELCAGEFSQITYLWSN